MAGSTWTSSELSKLSSYYGLGNRQQLWKVLPNRSWDAIKLKAKQLGLKFFPKDKVHEHVGADLSVLAQDTPIAFYWCGFIAADGSFSKSQRLKLVLASKDKDQVKRFCNFISCENHRPDGKGYGVAVQDKLWVPKIRHKFDFKPRKTYNPPDICWMEDDLFLSFFIGFVDGDGRISKQSGGRKDCFLTVRNHKSWRCVHQQMCDKISYQTGYQLNGPHIVGDISEFNIGRRSILQFLRIKAQELYLPVLKRKWNRIQL